MTHVRTPRRSFLRATAAVSAAAAAASQLRAAGANDRLGIGVIGCGGRGGSHMYAYAQLAQRGVNVRIAAVCDVYKPRLARAADAHKAAAYMRHEDLLADSGVDVVSIATPDHVHGAQTIDAVRAKKDVYCEKPFTHWRQFEVTKRAIAEVKKSGRVFQLGTQGMSDRAWHQAAALIKEGAIGKPIHAECGYFRVGDWGERGMPIDDPNARPGPDLNWEAFLGDSPKRPFDVSRFFRWRMYEDYAGGPVTDLNIMTRRARLRPRGAHQSRRDLRVVGAPQAVLRVAQQGQVSCLPLPAEQRLEELRRVALALDRDAHGVALRRL